MGNNSAKFKFHMDLPIRKLIPRKLCFFPIRENKSRENCFFLCIRENKSPRKLNDSKNRENKSPRKLEIVKSAKSAKFNPREN